MAREADKLAGAGSLLDKLKKRRQEVESGMRDAEEMVPTSDDRRGYTKESWDDNNTKG